MQGQTQATRIWCRATSSHLLAIAEVNGTQNSPDPLWNDSKITYWRVNGLLNGDGTQLGYFNNSHEKMIIVRGADASIKPGA